MITGRVFHLDKMQNYLHEVPAINMSIFWAAQDVCVFTGQAAVKFVALHLVSCIPTHPEQVKPPVNEIHFFPNFDRKYRSVY